MNKYLLLSLILGSLVLSGCARHGKIIIDPQGVDMAMYQTDLIQCKQLAEQVESKAAAGIVGGAVVGTVVGKILGGSGEKAGKLGALSGGLKGAGSSRRERTRVIKNCLRNRGYLILN